MTIEEARTLLESRGYTFNEEFLDGAREYVYYGYGDKTAILDGHFPPDELEAIAIVVHSFTREPRGKP